MVEMQQPVMSERPKILAGETLRRENLSLYSTYPVDIEVTLWNNVGVEEGRFTGCKQEGVRTKGCWEGTWVRADGERASHAG